MPFKMMNPLKKMDTTAMKTVQKSAMKLKDLNNDGKTTKADLLIKKGVYNKDGSPVTLSSPAKKFTPIESVAGDIADMASSISGMLKNSSLFDKSSYIPLTKAERKAKEEKESNKTETSKEADNQTKDSIELTKAELLAKQKKLAEEKAKLLAAKATKKAASSSGKKTTYSQAWDKMTDAAKGKYKSKADFIKAAKAYNVKIGKTKNPTATIPKEKETVTTETEKVTKANDISGNTGRNNSAADVLKRAKESAEKKKKEEEAKKKAAAEEAKKNKKLTPKEKRKAERNIKAQEKANKKIRGGGGTEIKVDKKNTTATAADRRKLKQGAKRLEQKLSLAQKEIDRKNKKKKEDKKGKDKKGKDNTSKPSKSLI